MDVRILKKNRHPFFLDKEIRLYYADSTMFQTHSGKQYTQRVNEILIIVLGLIFAVPNRVVMR